MSKYLVKRMGTNEEARQTHALHMVFTFGSRNAAIAKGVRDMVNLKFPGDVVVLRAIDDAEEWVAVETIRSPLTDQQMRIYLEM